MRVTILGAGSWGTALAIRLIENNHAVCMWSAFQKEVDELKATRKSPLLKGVDLPQSLELTADIAQAVQNTDFILIAVPSHVIRPVCQSLLPYYSGQPVISVAKGFDPETGERLSCVMEQELQTQNVVVLSGPTHAEEAAIGIPTAIVASCKDLEKAKQVQDLFMSSVLRVYTNADVIGAEVGGALKNVIALCAGISDGAGFGDNTKAALMTRGMAEILRLGIAMGGKPETFMGLTGMGDLIVTCTSMHSRNRKAGILIGQGASVEEAQKQVGMVVEGIKSCKEVYRLAQKYNVNMPIVQTAYRVLYHGESAKQAVVSLMLREKKEE